MIFTSPTWPLLLGVSTFGLLLLVATVITRGQRPRTGLHKATWLALMAVVLAYVDGGAAFAGFLVATLAFNYSAAHAIARAFVREAPGGTTGAATARTWLLVALAGNAGALIAMRIVPVFAYAPRMAALGAGSPLVGSKTLLPVGLSLLTFHAASFLLDVYERRVAGQKSVGQAGVYLVLLPQFIAGPTGYRGVAGQLSRRAVGMSDFSYGVRRLAIGVGKRVLIASPCAVAAADIFAKPPGQMAAAAAWLGIACFTVQVYFTFSGYGDMAIGLGRLFGFKLEENFRWPYAAGSVREFWRRWHIGLVTWFRDDVRLPRRLGVDAGIWSEALVILLCALWYGTTWSCLLWGIYHALFVALEDAGVVHVERMPRVFRHAYVLLVIVVGWVWLRADSLSDAVAILTAMAGQNGSARHVALPLSPTLWTALAAGAVGAAPMAPAIRRWSVAIDAATTSMLMMFFATVVFIWRWAALVVTSIGAWWRQITRGGPRPGAFY